MHDPRCFRCIAKMALHMGCLKGNGSGWWAELQAVVVVG